MGGFTTQLGGVLESEVTRSYNSFSGSDIRASIGQLQFAELQAVSYSVTREKAPIYTMGSADIRAFSRNKRGVAGSLIWINFDRHALLNLFRKARGRFVANVDDVLPQFQPDATGFLNQTAIFNSNLVRTIGLDVSATIDQLDNIPIDAVSSLKTLAAPWYSDQILPFDITLSGANEVGAATAMKIYGVEILNEGSGVSIDDAVTEMQATFVARLVEPWSAVSSPFSSTGGDFISAGLNNS
jgi:hypothetical protein